MPTHNVFSLRDVRFRAILAIDALDFPCGEVSCIVGKSGSGKTTLLRLLNHSLSPDAGRILFRDEEIASLDPVLLRRRVVLLGQTPVVFPGDVQANLEIGCRFAELPLPDEAAMNRMLAEVELAKKLSAKPEQLSGGEQQRLALARVLLMDPEVLLLDEPTAALDEGTEQLVFEKIVHKATDTRRATIMVTHSTRIAREFGDRLVRLEAGRIVTSGKTKSGEADNA